jgi:hypothetical protein
MHISTILTFTTSLALTTSAFPTFKRQTPPTYILTLKGADTEAFYTLAVPADNTFHPTNNALSISSVSSSNVNVATDCTLQTVDYPPALVQISGSEWNVGPPQTVTAVKCWVDGGNGGGEEDESVHVEFQGADPSEGAKYGVDVVTDGRVVPTSKYTFLDDGDDGVLEGRWLTSVIR